MQQLQQCLCKLYCPSPSGRSLHVTSVASVQPFLKPQVGPSAFRGTVKASVEHPSLPQEPSSLEHVSLVFRVQNNAVTVTLQVNAMLHLLLGLSTYLFYIYFFCNSILRFKICKPSPTSGTSDSINYKSEWHQVGKLQHLVSKNGRRCKTRLLDRALVSW